MLDLMLIFANKGYVNYDSNISVQTLQSSLKFIKTAKYVYSSPCNMCTIDHVAKFDSLSSEGSTHVQVATELQSSKLSFIIIINLYFCTHKNILKVTSAASDSTTINN